MLPALLEDFGCQGWLAILAVAAAAEAAAAVNTQVWRMFVDYLQLMEQVVAAAYTAAVVVAADLPFHLLEHWSTELEHFHIAAAEAVAVAAEAAAVIPTMVHNT